MNLLLLSLAVFVTVNAQDTCPANTCPISDTCCSLGEGRWGCCPFPDANCCSDKVHCCPYGYRCDIRRNQCLKESSNILNAMAVKLVRSCPCPADQTCCAKGNGQFGCCPFPAADCCADAQHCCPTGFRCSIADRECIQVSAATPSVSLVTVVKTQDTCPLRTCSTFDTCCTLGDGWGCCPWTNATCCNDSQHCCPRGYRCASSGTCITQSDVATQVVLSAGHLNCPVGTCLSGSTCCNLDSGGWACCPYENADCCTDHGHCCPTGYKCDIAQQQCTKSDGSFIDIRPTKLDKPA